MRSAVLHARRIVPALLLPLFIVAACVAVHPEDVTARTLPQHCDELAHGDCDDVWFCLIACFMEMIGLDDYCSQHPDAPQCQ